MLLQKVILQDQGLITLQISTLNEQIFLKYIFILK